MSTKDAMLLRMAELQQTIDGIRDPGAAMRADPAGDLAVAEAEITRLSGALGGDRPQAGLSGTGARPRAAEPPSVAPPAIASCTATTQTFEQTTPATIPDVGSLVSTVTVTLAGPYLWDVDLETFIRHTFPSDLDITLTSPAGTLVTITTDNGGTSDDVFNGTRWDDQAGASNPPGAVTDATYAVSILESPLAPEEAMGAFVGENPNGVWTLTIADDALDDTGTLDRWGVTVTTCAATPALATASFASSGTTAIVDNTTSTSQITVSGIGTRIHDVALNTSLAHTFPADLEITLASPAGTVTSITTDNGGGADDVFNGTAWSDRAGATAAPGPVTDATFTNGVIQTALVPEEALAAFAGEDPNGVWTLTLTDDTGGDSGVLSAWSLDVRTFAEVTITGVTPASGSTSGATPITITGSGFSPTQGATVTLGGTAAQNVTVVNASTITAETPARVAGVVDLAVSSAGNGATLTGGFTYLATGAATTDTDGDGMTDVWELQFGLDALNASDGPTDPDGDGKTNLQEYQDGSHPRGNFTWFFAEGTTSDFFETSFATVNPANGTAAVLFRFLKADGSTASRFLSLGGRRRATLDAKAVSGLETAEFSTVVESDVRVVADRTMTWDSDDRYGSHAETSIAAASDTWYLAEGATHSGFSLFYLIQNPNPSAVDVQVTYLLPAAPPVVKTYTVPASSRFNIWVNQEALSLPQLASTDVSAVLRSNPAQPIIVERAMYLNSGGLTFGSGHESAGVTAPATAWFLAEGATGSYFDLFVLLANPNGVDALVRADYLLPTGTVVSKTYTVAANSRLSIAVDQEDSRLADTAVSTTLTSTNGVTFLAERAMWWPSPVTSWHEAHNSPGATATGTQWAVAEGEVGGTTNLQTYILVANTSAFPGTASVTLLFEDGTTSSKTFSLAASSRLNVDVAAEFPTAAGRRFGAIIESLGTPKIQLVVERAIYGDANGLPWAAGTNSLATKLQ